MNLITEIDLIGCDLPTDSPYVINGVMNTQFSIARFYGGIEFNGFSYFYCADHDQLVRRDVLVWITKQRKAAAKAQRDADKAKAKAAQQGIEQ
jgi:hypothetical protein